MAEHSEGVAGPSLDDLEARLSGIFDDRDFHAIHRQMSTFNLFEAVGAIRAELRHSNFLAYLLSPSRPHGLGIRPLAAILRAVLAHLSVSQRPIMMLELIAGELSDAIVYRERDGIDILIDMPSLNLVVVIENKIDAKAGLGQLERYSRYLRSAFPNRRRLLVFLTPDGTPSHHDHYVSYNYADLVDVLGALIADRREPIPDETLLIIRHYVDMVRRHIVRDDQLREIALALYERHKEAFEFIFECRPELSSLLTVVRQNVAGVQGLVIESNGSNLFRFLPENWDKLLTIIKGDPGKWSKTGRGILFEAKIYPNAPGRVNIALILGPGDPAMRSQVYKAAVAQPKVFTGLVTNTPTLYVTVSG